MRDLICCYLFLLLLSPHQTLSIPFFISLSDTEVELNDSDKEEELIELARRKRQAILEKFR